MNKMVCRLAKCGLCVLLPFITAAGLHSQPKYDSIDSLIISFMAKNHVPGFAACVVKGSGMTRSKMYGQADIAKNKPMDPDVIMNIGSISKTFTATAAMQLWEKGLLDLDADINQYLDFTIRNPRYPDKPITIYQVLTHTSSIQDGKAYGESYSCGDPTISLYEWIYHCLTPGGKYYYDKSNFAKWAPGKKALYSNIAFGVLGLIVERVSGKPFNEYCRDNIFKPLGMKNTGWFLKEVDTSCHVKPYIYISPGVKKEAMQNRKFFPGESEFRTGSYVEYCLYSFPNYPDGLVRTSIRELSIYLAAIMNGGELNGTKILNKTTVDKMLTVLIKGTESQGLCWVAVEIDSPVKHRLLWGHTGGDPGISTYLFFDPIAKTGVITFQNSDTGDAMEIVKQLYFISK